MKKNKKRIPLYAKKIYPLLLLIAALFMGIGYASINSITLDLKGTVMANMPDLFIADVSYLSDVNANVEESKIINMSGTMLNSKVVLSDTDANSSITYNVTIYNNTDISQSFSGVKYDAEFYDNEFITFELNGLNVGDEIASKSQVTFTITFHYLDNSLASNNILNSYLNFEFKDKYNVQYVNVSASDITTNKYPLFVFDGDTLNITLSNKIKKLHVTMGDKQLVLDTDYTFNNNVLNIPNVNANLIIEVETIVTPVQGSDGHYYEGEMGENFVDVQDGWTGDVYTLTFGVDGKIGSATDYVYTVKVVNNTAYTWNNLQSSDVIVDPGGGWLGLALQEFSSSLSHQELKPGETLVITFNVRYRTNLDCTASGQTIIKFNTNGEEKQLELNIEFEMI